MSLDADSIVDRRRLRRSLAGWRILAILLIVAGAAVAAFAFGGFDAIGRRSPHIARLSITGVIGDDRKRLEMIDRLGKSPAVSAVIVSIASPGGTTAGGEGLYAALRGLAERKPVVAYVGSLGTSAGYMAALATDHIVARRSAITGSIGVLFQYGDAQRLLDTIGVTIAAEKSGPLKAEPDPFSPATPEARAMLAGVVDDSYQWFLSLVTERRRLAAEEARTLADGRIFTGHQALEAGLVDAVGEERVAIDWLETEKGVAKGLPVHDWKPEDDSGLLSSGALGEALGHGIVDAALSALGLPPADDARLDGLLSLWQASGPKQGGRFAGATR
jgi:protease-4